MRSLLLASAALLGLAGATAYAQTSTTGAAGPGAAAGSQGVPPPAETSPAGMSPAQGPGATAAPGNPSGEQPGARSEPVAPHPAAPQHMAHESGQPGIAGPLPAADLAPDGSAMQYLRSAQEALNHHRRGEAEEALERAETRLLDRSATPSAADQPDASPRIRQVGEARRALSRGDIATASERISEALNAGPYGDGRPGGAMPGGAMSSGRSMSGGAMSGGGVPDASMTNGSTSSESMRYDPSVGTRSDMGGPAVATPSTPPAPTPPRGVTGP